MLTFIQLEKAYQLAAAHSHGWAIEKVFDVIQEASNSTASTAVPQHVVWAIESLAQDAFPEGAIYKPHTEEDCFGRTHVKHQTGTGRLSWEIDEDGGVTLEICRPTGAVFADAIQAAETDKVRNQIVEQLRVTRAARIGMTLRFGWGDEFKAPQDITDSVPVLFRQDHIDTLVNALLALHEWNAEAALHTFMSTNYDTSSKSTQDLRRWIATTFIEHATDRGYERELNATFSKFFPEDNFYIEATRVEHGLVTLTLLHSENGQKIFQETVKLGIGVVFTCLKNDPPVPTESLGAFQGSSSRSEIMELTFSATDERHGKSHVETTTLWKAGPLRIKVTTARYAEWRNDQYTHATARGAVFLYADGGWKENIPRHNLDAYELNGVNEVHRRLAQMLKYYLD